MGKKAVVATNQLAVDFTVNRLTVAPPEDEFKDTILSQKIETAVDVTDRLWRLFISAESYKNATRKRGGYAFDRYSKDPPEEYKKPFLHRFFEKREVMVRMADAIAEACTDPNINYFIKHPIPHEYIRHLFKSEYDFRHKADYKKEGYTIPEFIQGLKHKAPELELYMTARVTGIQPIDLAMERENKKWWERYCNL